MVFERRSTPCSTSDRPFSNHVRREHNAGGIVLLSDDDRVCMMQPPFRCCWSTPFRMRRVPVV